MTERSKERTYSDAEVKERLQRELPHWYLEGGWIRRKYRTHGWKGTLMVINTVGHLAESAWHHPDITASYAWVEVRLQNHAAKGITDKDFELAKKIEDVVHWQPGKEEDRSRARRRRISASPISSTTNSCAGAAGRYRASANGPRLDRRQTRGVARRTLRSGETARSMSRRW